MSLLGKCVAANRTSAGRDRSLHSSRPERKADRDGSYGAKPDDLITKRNTFAEDFMLEHSCAGVYIALISVPGGSGASSQKSQESSESFGFPS